jgi:hypothetical protein
MSAVTLSSADRTKKYAAAPRTRINARTSPVLTFIGSPNPSLFRQPSPGVLLSEGHAERLRIAVRAREDDGSMTAPTVDAAIHELMDLAWNVVYDLLEERDLLGDGFFVEEYTGIHSWLDGSVRYTVVHSRTLAVLFMDTRPVDAIVFHHELLGADDPASYFTLPG